MVSSKINRWLYESYKELTLHFMHATEEEKNLQCMV